MAPRKQYSIGVKLSGGSNTEAVWLTFKNGRTSDFFKIKTTAAAAGEAVINLSQLTSDGKKTGTHTNLQNGDVISISASGSRKGSANHTVDVTKGGAKITLTVEDISTTNAPALTIG